MNLSWKQIIAVVVALPALMLLMVASFVISIFLLPFTTKLEDEKLKKTVAAGDGCYARHQRANASDS